MSKKKLIFRTLALGSLLSMGYGIFFIGTALPIISGYNAKILCSCVMVTGRSADDVIQNELSSALISLARSEVNFNDSSATSEVFGFAKRKAIYRKGLGCTLVNEITEEELRNQRFNLAQRPAINQDSILWPSGNLFTEISIEGLDFEKVNKVVEEAFEEPGEEKTRRTRAILIVYRNQVIAEKYAKGYGPHTKMMGWSMAKSITNAMTGILVKQGKLSIHEPAPISEWENDERSKITLHHLLQASSGLDWEEIYAGPSDATNMLFKNGMLESLL
ncbi:MAG: serine hydrolase [Flammeovirgaceae bacterium]|nr:serine hydrolase [Flammeovirgaceae bacterium]